MNKLDGRKISHATLEEIRIRTVSMVRKGLSPEVAAKNLGFNRSTIYAWLKAYSERGGRRALKLKPVPGRPSRLNGRQISWICKALTSDKIQLQFEVCLWTRDRLRVVIKKKFKVSLGKTATGDLLRKLGFTFQKPTTDSYNKTQSSLKNGWKLITKISEQRLEKLVLTCISVTKLESTSTTKSPKQLVKKALLQSSKEPQREVK